MNFDWVLAQWCLSIWNPSLMDWVKDKKRRNSRRMFYRAMGIVVHDRVLKFKRAYTGGPLFGGDGAEAIALGIALLAQVKNDHKHRSHPRQRK